MIMKRFFANLVAMFFISKKLRGRIRAAILDSETPSPEAINENKIQEIDKAITEKQKILNDLEKKYNYLHLKSEWLTKNPRR